MGRLKKTILIILGLILALIAFIIYDEYRADKALQKYFDEKDQQEAQDEIRYQERKESENIPKITGQEALDLFDELINSSVMRPNVFCQLSFLDYDQYESAEIKLPIVVRYWFNDWIMQTKTDDGYSHKSVRTNPAMEKVYRWQTGMQDPIRVIYHTDFAHLKYYSELYYTKGVFYEPFDLFKAAGVDTDFYCQRDVVTEEDLFMPSAYDVSYQADPAYFNPREAELQKILQEDGHLLIE